MSGNAGSTTLTNEQSDWFERALGVRYVAVQTNADMQSRKQRRAAKRQQRRRPDGKPFGG